MAKSKKSKIQQKPKVFEVLENKRFSTFRNLKTKEFSSKKESWIKEISTKEWVILFLFFWE